MSEINRVHLLLSRRMTYIGGSHILVLMKVFKVNVDVLCEQPSTHDMNTDDVF